MHEDGGGGGIRWGDVILASLAAVGWALVGMAGVAALGLHLLGADPAGALGPMTAAVVVLGVGGSVTPWGDVSVFGGEGTAAGTAVDITPLGVGLVGALLLSYVFLRSLRAAAGPAYVSGRELAARVGVLVAAFVAVAGGPVWVGRGVVPIDAGSLGVGGVGDLVGVGGKASVGFRVDVAESLAGAACWALGVVLLALLASRRAPLPPGRGWDAVRRVVRPAASALVTVAVVAVAAGWAAAGYAAIGDDHPGRVVGAALLGAPNGVWLGVAFGLFVPWEGRASGGSAGALPDPLGDLLRVSSGEPVTVGRLAELDRGVWLLVGAAGLLMLGAGVLTAVRTARGGLGAVAFAGRCAVRLAAVTAAGLPLVVWLTGVSAGASLSALGVDGFGGVPVGGVDLGAVDVGGVDLGAVDLGAVDVGAVDVGGVDGVVELRGDGSMAVLLGALWGGAAGGAGALLARGAGVAGRAPSLPPVARAVPWGPGAPGVPGPYTPSVPYRPPNPDTNPYLRLPDPGGPPEGRADGWPERGRPGG
ncbi:streptophobe family protein [Streptomyces sp. CB03234]|uniref:streptophobe family protein n=1 Tax=Streptomyces sp. (strain CB03234) TaxID=1703937 RepID=UPI00093E77D6